MSLSSSRFTSQVRIFGGFARVALGVSLGLLASSTAQADGQLPTVRTDVSNRTGNATLRYNANPVTGELVEHTGVCQGSRFHCLARIVTHAGGHIQPHATVAGTTAKTIQEAYGISGQTMSSTATIAIVDAFGYSTLEADLAVYRTQMQLPPCTKANGCLTILNQTGGTTLPANPPPTDDWTVETALDVDMASAACPTCKIVVYQTTTDQDDGLFIANNTAAAAGVTVISNSWGGAEQGGESAYESYFAHPGIAIFVAAGDAGYNDNGKGPDYPATSGNTISVGATALLGSTGNYTERVWGGTGTSYSATQITQTGAGGSACSLSIPKPSYQPASSGCAFKATADVSALGDPSTGPAIYDSNAGGWQTVGGTSASSPMVAAMMAGAGHGSITGKFFYDNMAKFHDVTQGANGSCGTILCTAGAGWDGPTGVGTPNVAAIISTGGGTGGNLTIGISSPAPNAVVGEGFHVTATASDGVVMAQLLIDGNIVDEVNAAPFTFIAPTDLTLGDHMIEVDAFDSGGNTAVKQEDVTVTADGPVNPDPTGGNGDNGAGSNDVVGGCAAGGSGAGLGTLLVLGAVVLRRRRKTA